MPKKPTVTTIASGYASTTTLNNNFEALREGFDNTLSLDGSTPNAMQADLDMDGNDILDAGSIIVGGQDLLAATQANLNSAAVAQAQAAAAVTAAEISETNAATSASKASTSASNAATSASQAASSALAASGSATASATSALAAENAETNAETAETNAQASALAALASEIAAAASEAGVDADRVAAQAAATAAAASETAAATSETNAATSEANAANSATASATSATASAASATAASASESAANTSALNADFNATAAEISATNAAFSAANAAANSLEANNFATAAALSEANALSYVADSESARDQSQDARDTANLHKLAAEAAATSATNTAAALTGFDLEAIAESKVVTAVDVFVYDTSKDSDGGAWRKRTQGTSWYNETLNTATRGSRREFPAVAVIVAEIDTVTIYDGDDPSLPMWMVFGGGSNAMPTTSSSTIKSVLMLNGLIAVGMGPYDLHLIDFLKDAGTIINAVGYADYKQNIADRNVIVSPTYYTDASRAIASRTVNDVAMTVLPNAPIDPATGLPVSTIACATDGGVSVIKDDGTVVDSADTIIARYLDTLGHDMWWGRNFSNNPLRRTSLVGIADSFSYDSYSRDTAPAIYTNDATSLATAGSSVAIASKQNTQGLFLADPYGDLSVGSICYVTSKFNTGWMNGDIKGAFLSDTDDTDLVGSGELVTNGTFDTDTSGWTALSGTISSVGGLLRITEDGADGVTARAYQIISTEIGQRYKISVDAVSSSLGDVIIAVNTSSSTSGATQVSVAPTGQTVTFEFVASVASTYIILAVNGTSARTADFDNISVKLADADRSVNDNGLIVNGTVTRTPVATGADLVAYSGFSASNYLEQPYSSDLDFGTGDFCVMGWVKTSGTGWIATRFDSSNYGLGLFGTATSLSFKIGPSASANDLTATVASGVWLFVGISRSSGTLSMSVNGSVVSSVANTDTVNGAGDAALNVGALGGVSSFAGSLALLRISATAPTASQIEKIYEDEKVLFQENAQATLYGASDAVTALAHDDDTGILSVGTSAGRSDFQGLRRVNNTTTAVGVAISASNGMIVEE